MLLNLLLIQLNLPGAKAGKLIIWQENLEVHLFNYVNQISVVKMTFLMSLILLPIFEIHLLFDLHV